MTDRVSLHKGLTRALWGYVFLTCNVKIGPGNIMPEFIGWFCLLCALSYLREARRDLALLRPFAQVMTLWSMADGLSSLLGRSLGLLLPPLMWLSSAAALYFHFQFLTDCAALAAARGREDLRRSLLRQRTVRTVVQTGLVLSTPFAEAAEGIGTALLMAAALIYIVASLCVIAALASLRRCFAGRAQEPAEPV